MNPQLHRRPLDSHPAIRSGSIGEIEQLLSQTYGARRFLPGSRVRSLNVHANHWQSEAMALSFCAYGAAVEVQFPEADFWRQQFALQGGCNILAGSRAREIGVNRFCVVPPEESLTIRFRPGMEQIVLRLNENFLRSKHHALYGPGAMTIDMDERLATPALARLRRLVDFAAQEIALGGLSAIEMRELEQSVAIGFLASNLKHDHPAGLDAPSLAQLRAVEDHIAAHWNQPLSIEALAEAAGTSARSIFYHFRKRHGMTPRQFIKERRLLEARALLERRPELSITEVAMLCGFGNLGHFAADYRRRWGEKPRETRQRRH